MDMRSWGFTVNDKEATSVRLTKFFEGLIDALKTYHEDRSASFADESRKFARNVLYKVLLKLAHRHPDLDLSGIFRKLPRNTSSEISSRTCILSSSNSSSGSLADEGLRLEVAAPGGVAQPVRDRRGDRRGPELSAGG
jgi:hypothetical protein